MEMLTNTIFISNPQNRESQSQGGSLEEFRKLPQAQTPRAKLFLELLDEKDLPPGLKVSGYFIGDEEAFQLTVHSDLFMMRRDGSSGITIKSNDGVTTVDQVAVLIIGDYTKHEEAVFSTAHSLEVLQYQIKREKEKILTGIARRTLRSKIPDAKISSESIEFRGHLFFEEKVRGRVFHAYLYDPTVIFTMSWDDYLKYKDFVGFSYEENQFLINHSKKLE